MIIALVICKTSKVIYFRTKQHFIGRKMPKVYFIDKSVLCVNGCNLNSLIYKLRCCKKNFGFHGKVRSYLPSYTNTNIKY